LIKLQRLPIDFEKLNSFSTTKNSSNLYLNSIIQTSMSSYSLAKDISGKRKNTSIFMMLFLSKKTHLQILKNMRYPSWFLISFKKPILFYSAFNTELKNHL